MRDDEPGDIDGSHRGTRRHLYTGMRRLIRTCSYNQAKQMNRGIPAGNEYGPRKQSDFRFY